MTGISRFAQRPKPNPVSHQVNASAHGDEQRKVTFVDGTNFIEKKDDTNKPKPPLAAIPSFGVSSGFGASSGGGFGFRASSSFGGSLAGKSTQDSAAGNGGSGFSRFGQRNKPTTHESSVETPTSPMRQSTQAVNQESNDAPPMAGQGGGGNPFFYKNHPHRPTPTTNENTSHEAGVVATPNAEIITTNTTFETHQATPGAMYAGSLTHDEASDSQPVMMKHRPNAPSPFMGPPGSSNMPSRASLPNIVSNPTAAAASNMIDTVKGTKQAEHATEMEASGAFTQDSFIQERQSPSGLDGGLDKHIRMEFTLARQKMPPSVDESKTFQMEHNIGATFLAPKKSAAAPSQGDEPFLSTPAPSDRTRDTTEMLPKKTKTAVPGTKDSSSMAFQGEHTALEGVAEQGENYDTPRPFARQEQGVPSFDEDTQVEHTSSMTGNHDYVTPAPNKSGISFSPPLSGLFEESKSCRLLNVVTPAVHAADEESSPQENQGQPQDGELPPTDFADWEAIEQEWSQYLQDSSDMKQSLDSDLLFATEMLETAHMELYKYQAKVLDQIMEVEELEALVDGMIESYAS